MTNPVATSKLLAAAAATLALQACAMAPNLDARVNLRLADKTLDVEEHGDHFHFSLVEDGDD